MAGSVGTGDSALDRLADVERGLEVVDALLREVRQRHQAVHVVVERHDHAGRPQRRHESVHDGAHGRHARALFAVRVRHHQGQLRLHQRRHERQQHTVVGGVHRQHARLDLLAGAVHGRRLAQLAIGQVHGSDEALHQLAERNHHTERAHALDLAGHQHAGRKVLVAQHRCVHDGRPQGQVGDAVQRREAQDAAGHCLADLELALQVVNATVGNARDVHVARAPPVRHRHRGAFCALGFVPHVLVAVAAVVAFGGVVRVGVVGLFANQHAQGVVNAQHHRVAPNRAEFLQQPKAHTHNRQWYSPRSSTHPAMHPTCTPSKATGAILTMWGAALRPIFLPAKSTNKMRQRRRWPSE